MGIQDPNSKQLREHLLYLLNGGGAHARFDDVVKNMAGGVAWRQAQRTPTRPGCF